MNYDEAATEIYRVKKERREEIENSIARLGHEERRLSHDAQTELRRYILLGSFGYVSFLLLNLSNVQSIWLFLIVIVVGFIICGVTFFGMFIDSLASYHQAEHYFHDALYRYRQMDNDAFSNQSKIDSDKNWALAEAYRKWSMILFYTSCVLFVLMIGVSMPVLYEFLLATRS